MPQVVHVSWCRLGLGVYGSLISMLCYERQPINMASIIGSTMNISNVVDEGGSLNEYWRQDVIKRSFIETQRLLLKTC